MAPNSLLPLVADSGLAEKSKYLKVVMRETVESTSFTDFIEKSQWITGPASASMWPTISVIGIFDDTDNEGTYGSMLVSILSQTYEDIELIQVEDSRGHRLYESWRAALESDERVKLLLHPEPCGLLGLSLAEAIIRTRGRYLLFALNGVVFAPTALEDLLHAIRDADPQESGAVMALGQVENISASQISTQPFHPEALKYQSCVPVSALLIPRILIDICGLPDPRLSMCSHAVWDYIRRLSEASIVQPTKVNVGSKSLDLVLDRMETGLPQLIADGLPFTRWREDLLPVNIGTYPIFNRSSYDTAGSDRSKVDIPNLLIVGRLEAPISLVFEQLRNRKGYQITFIEPFGISDIDIIQIITKSSAVIVARVLHPDTEYDRILYWCERLKVAYFYYADDNFTALINERADFEWYTIDNMRRRLTTFSGVIVTSTGLAQFYQESRLHARIFYVRPVYDNFMDQLFRNLNFNHMKKDIAPEVVNIGFFGSSFRNKSFQEIIIPAIERASTVRPCVISVRSNTQIETKLPVNYLPAHRSFKNFILEWRKAKIDIIVHAAGESRNISYKTANAILCSHYIGAVPMVFDEPAYSDFTSKDGITVVSSCDHRVWEKNIVDHLDPERRGHMRKRLEHFVHLAFNDDMNDSIVRELVGSANVESAEKRYLRVLRTLLC